MNITNFIKNIHFLNKKIINKYTFHKLFGDFLSCKLNYCAKKLFDCAFITIILCNITNILLFCEINYLTNVKIFDDVTCEKIVK